MSGSLKILSPSKDFLLKGGGGEHTSCEIYRLGLPGICVSTEHKQKTIAGCVLIQCQEVLKRVWL